MPVISRASVFPPKTFRSIGKYGGGTWEGWGRSKHKLGIGGLAPEGTELDPWSKRLLRHTGSIEQEQARVVWERKHGVRPGKEGSVWGSRTAWPVEEGAGAAQMRREGAVIRKGGTFAFGQKKKYAAPSVGKKGEAGVYKVLTKKYGSEAAVEAANAYERARAAKISITTPTGLQVTTAGEVLGKDVSQYAELMAHKSATDNLPLGQVKASIEERFRRQWWKENLKEISLKRGPHADLSLFPQDSRASIERIVKLGQQSGWKAEQGQYSIQGMDDIINTMTLVKKGRKSIPVPVPSMGGRYAYTKTEGGVEGHILQGFQPMGAERMPYLQAQGSMLEEEMRNKVGAGRTDYGRAFEKIDERMQPARKAAKHTMYDFPHMAHTHSERLLQELGEVSMYKDNKLDPKAGMASLEDISKRHVTTGYSTVMQNPKHFLEQGKLSNILLRDVPFAGALNRAKPSYYRYGAGPLMSNLLKGTAAPPIIGVETARSLREVLPLMPKGTVHEHYVKTRVITDPYAHQVFAGGAEGIVVSEELHSILRVGGRSHEGAMAFTAGGSKSSLLMTAPRALMEGVDVVMGPKVAANELYRTWVGHGAYEAQKRGGREGLNEYLKELGRFDKGNSFQAQVSWTRGSGEHIKKIRVEVADELNYGNFMQHLQQTTEKMGLPVPMVDVHDQGYDTWLPFARRDFGVEIVNRGRPFRPTAEWRHMRLAGAGDLAEFMLKKGAKMHPEGAKQVRNVFMPFAGRGTELGSIGDNIYAAKDIGDLSWLLESDITASQAHRTQDPFFRSAWEKGVTIDLGKEIEVTVGAQMDAGGTMLAEGISTRTSYLHIPALKRHRDAVGMLVHPEAVHGNVLAGEAKAYISPAFKKEVEVLMAARAMGVEPTSVAETAVAERARIQMEALAGSSGKGSYIRSLAEPRLEHSSYLRIMGAPAEGSGIESLDCLARHFKSAGGISPGIGEVAVGTEELHRLGLHKRYQAGEEMTAVLQAYPEGGRRTTVPVRVLHDKALLRGEMRVHASEAIGMARDYDWDPLALFSDPSEEFQKSARAWYLKDQKNKTVIYDMFTQNLKSRGGAVTAAQIISDTAKATKQTPEMVAAVIQSLYATKALTGPVNSALAPYRLIAEDVFKRQSKEHLANATADALTMMEQTVIQKGTGTSNDALQYLQSIIVDTQETADVAKLSTLLRDTADTVVKSGMDTGKSFEPMLFSGTGAAATAYQTEAAQGLRALQLAHLTPEYRGIMGFMRRVFGARKGHEVSGIELINLLSTDAPKTAEQRAMRRVMGLAEAGPILARKESALLSDLNAASVERGVGNAAKPLWASVKHLWGSLPAWGKVAGVGLGVLGGAAMVRGVMGGSLDAPAMTIPPEVLMKELYGSGGGSPVPPAMIDVPQHQQYTPSRMMDTKPPARLRMDNRQYDIRLHGMDNGYGDPSNMPAEFDKLLRHDVGVSPSANIRIDGPNVRDTRRAAMRRFSDMSESRFYG